MNVALSSGGGVPAIDRLVYFWGLFKAVREIRPAEARIKGTFVRPAIPEVIVESFMAERMAEFSGEFGDSSVGKPIEVDWLEISCSGRVTTVRVFNRSIALLTESVAGITRLHRFFCTVQRCIRS